MTNSIKKEDAEKEKLNKEIRLKNRSFFVTSILSASISLLGLLVKNVDLINFEWVNTLKFPNFSIIIWIGLFAGLYIITALVIESKSKRRERFINKIFRVPVWSELRNFGDKNVAKVSYLGLILIPLFAFFYNKDLNGMVISELITFPENLKIIYFASWSFSIALILFGIGCPKEIRIVKSIENAKNVNLILNNVKSPRIVVQDESGQFPHLDSESLFLRGICFLFYVIGIVLTLIVLIRGANLVFNV